MATRRLLRPLSAPLLALTLVLAVSACGSNDTTPSANGTTATTKKEAPNVVAKDFAFTLAKGTVKAGSEVYFANQDQTDHTMTADDGSSFDTGPVAPGKQAELDAPKTPGTYSFHCSIHSSMTATLTVQ